ncbi:MAG: hypothetical protein BGN86_13530 [Caulobacterales bacterium 68-7]|nr:MAG: hypothetical protein BGN86_13530 [Caulobacterales bacterium 68-7]
MSFNSRAAGAAALCLGLAACAESQPTLHPSFGMAVRADVAAQIADPDANYANRPAPATDGRRLGLAMERYREGKVTKPTASASEVGEAAAGNGGSPGMPALPSP